MASENAPGPGILPPGERASGATRDVSARSRWDMRALRVRPAGHRSPEASTPTGAGL